MWECSKLMASEEAELARLNAAVRWHDSAVDAWVKADEKQILKEWFEEKGRAYEFVGVLTWAREQENGNVETSQRYSGRCAVGEKCLLSLL